MGGINPELTDDGVTTALNTVHIYSGNNTALFPLGTNVPPNFLLDSDTKNLNQTAYEHAAPLHITSFWLSGYIASFLSIAAVISHVGIWYGKDIKNQIMSMIKKNPANENKKAYVDKHVEFMKAYYYPPDWMFLCLLGVCTALMLYCNIFTAFKMPPWGIFLALLVAGIFLIPSGIIRAVSFLF